MHSTSAHSEVANGTLFDGSSALDRPVSVAAAEDGLVIRSAEGSEERLPPELLRIDSDSPRQLRIGRTDREGWTLVLHKPVDPALASALPKTQRYGGLIDRIGFAPALVAAGLLTAGAVGIGYLAPHWIAPHVPTAWEQKLGASITGDLAGVRCDSREGAAALEALVERIEPGATHPGPDQIRITAVDFSPLNAAALPGGQIVVFRGALEDVDPDALAGIVAHEIAHVRRRHVMEGMLREMGIGALLGMFGGQWAANAGQLMSLSYTREAEAEADRDAIAALRRARIDPRPTAELFRKLGDGEGRDSAAALDWLSSHPASQGRAERFAASSKATATYRPALTEQQGEALRSACAD